MALQRSVDISREYMVATISTDPIVLQNEVRQMETEMKRLVLQAQRFPYYIRNIQLKYKLC